MFSMNGGWDCCAMQMDCVGSNNWDFNSRKALFSYRKFHTAMEAARPVWFHDSPMKYGEFPYLYSWSKNLLAIYIYIHNIYCIYIYIHIPWNLQFYAHIIAMDKLTVYHLLPWWVESWIICRGFKPRSSWPHESALRTSMSKQCMLKMVEAKLRVPKHHLISIIYINDIIYSHIGSVGMYGIYIYIC